MTPIALMVGSNRVIPGSGICYPVGNSELGPKEEKALRQAIVNKALEALQTELTDQELFPRPI
jgi:glycine reductase